jgi:hypothetical protein
MYIRRHIPSYATRQRCYKKQLDEKVVIDICSILANTFYLNIKREENVFFITSLYKVDRILKDRAKEVG